MQLQVVMYTAEKYKNEYLKTHLVKVMILKCIAERWENVKMFKIQI